MTKADLTAQVAANTDMTKKDADKAVNAVFEALSRALANGEKVTIAGFGRFEMRERQTKNFTNPKTKVTSQLQPTAIPGFKASGRLKEKVSK